MNIVIINDFTNNSRSTIILKDDNLKKAEVAWAKEDKILLELQETSFFAGRKRWCDLTPTHFRLMIAHNITISNKLSDVEKLNTNNTIIQSLHFLISALIICLQIRAECLIELMRIDRINENDVTYDFSASLYTTQIKPKIDLHLIVDNES